MNHGIPTTYNQGGCRCRPCTDAHNRYQKQRRLDRLRGIERMAPATGTMRRLQGLALMQYGLGAVAAVTGMNPAVLARIRGGQRTAVARQTEVVVIAAFRELSQRLGPDPRARTWALKAGWLPAHAYDDIDDPAEQPNVTALPDRDAWLEDAEWLAASGCGLEEAARRLGFTPTQLQRRLQRAGRHELARRLTGWEVAS